MMQIVNSKCGDDKLAGKQSPKVAQDSGFRNNKNDKDNTDKQSDNIMNQSGSCFSKTMNNTS